jgi:hypothetical protein
MELLNAIAFTAVPATAGAHSVIVPLVAPASVKQPCVVPATPTVKEVFAVTVVNVPAAAAVPPIAGGEARYVEKPVPVTVLDALSVVNAPVEGVVLPIGPGEANVAPPSVVALFVPDPLTVSDEPEPSTIAAVVFVPDEMAVNEVVAAEHPEQLVTVRAPADVTLALGPSAINDPLAGVSCTCPVNDWSRALPLETRFNVAPVSSAVTLAADGVTEMISELVGPCAMPEMSPVLVLPMATKSPLALILPVRLIMEIPESASNASIDPVSSAVTFTPVDTPPMLIPFAFVGPAVMKSKVELVPVA